MHTMPLGRPLVASLLTAACNPTLAVDTSTARVDVREDEPAAVAQAQLPTPTFVAGPLVIEPIQTAEGELPEAPTARVAEIGGTMMDHATRFGWSRDGRQFGVCVPSGGIACLDCTFVELDGHTERLSGLDAGADPDEGDGRCTPAEADEIERRWRTRDFGVHGRRWPFGGEVQILWRVQETEERSTLVVGARRGEDGPLGRVVTITEPMPRLHPELMILDADGSHLAIVSHGFAGEFRNAFQIELVPSGRLAAAAFEAAGVQAIADGQFEAAVDPLLRATAADDEGWLAPFHLARAWVAIDDPRAELALAEALARDEHRARRRAREDPSFEAVRDAPWFRSRVEDPSPP